MRMFAALLLLASPALADIVHLRNGGKLEGKVTDKGEKYEIETATGTVTLEKDQVLRIEKKEFTPPKTALPKKSPAKLGTPYSHPFEAFKIYLPPQWARGKEHGKEGQTNASFYGPKDQFYTPRMDLKIDRNSKELPDVVAAYKDAFRKAFKDVTFLYEEGSAVRGKTAWQFLVAFKDGDPPLAQQALFTFVAEGDRKYILSFNCTAAWFDRYYGLVDGSMKSLRIFPESKLTPEQRQKFLGHYNNGARLYKEGKHDLARVDFEAAAALVPTFADVHATLGTLHMRRNDYPAAEASYRKAVEIDPEDASGHYNLGVCLLKESKLDESVDALERAVALEPAMEAGQTNLGVAYLKKEQYDSARMTLEKAVRTDPESVPAHYNLAYAFERLNRKKDAEREYQEALKLDPAHEEARAGLERARAKK